MQRAVHSFDSGSSLWQPFAIVDPRYGGPLPNLFENIMQQKYNVAVSGEDRNFKFGTDVERNKS